MCERVEDEVIRNDNEVEKARKFSFGRVECEKIFRHPVGNVLFQEK